MTAKDILRLIEAKHCADVFVSECKNGPSQTSNHFRMDAWSMNKSWANPLVVAYEIKISRADFLKDNKWMAYLPCCNQFYFVCPRGLITPDEVSPQAGLIYVASTGTMLVTKKQAPYREVQIPETLWRYILMCRTTTCAEREQHRESDHGRIWRDWLDEKTEWKDIGWKVSRKIRQHVETVERENAELAERISTFEEIKTTLVKLGIDPNGRWLSAFDVKEKVKRLNDLVPDGFVQSLEKIEKHCSAVRRALLLPQP